MKTSKPAFSKELIQDKIVSHPWYDWFINFTQRIYFSKKKDITYFEIGKAMYNELKKNDLNSESRAVAYSFIIALFPSIIFLFTLLPSLPISITDKDILAFLRNGMQLPISMEEAITSTINDILDQPRGGLQSISFIMALAMSTNGMIALMDSFNKCYSLKDKRGFFKRRLIALGLTLLLSLVLFFAIIILVFGPTIVETIFQFGGDIIHIDLHVYEKIKSFRLIEYGVFILIFFFTISILYYFAPVTHEKWSFFSPGTFIATILCVLTTAGLSFYISKFDSYNKLYGSIGALIGFMLWMQLISLMLLIGFEINTGMDSVIIDKNTKKNNKNKALQLEQSK
jgi:membrane protein